MQVCPFWACLVANSALGGMLTHIFIALYSHGVLLDPQYWVVLEPFVFEMVVFILSYITFFLIVCFQVKMRILMGTYALSAGYYDAYYKRAQQVRAEQWHLIQCLCLDYYTTYYAILCHKNSKVHALQQVRTLVKESFKGALERYDILISPAASSAAYKIGML